jgi:hypothetical protein
MSARSTKHRRMPGTKSDELFNHYSMLKTTEQLLGLDSRLGHAADSQGR